jgi:hypothetical protein
MGFIVIPVRCTHLGGTIATCWTEAESRVIADIRERHSRPNETEITFLFRGHLREVVGQASARRDFENALRVDLTATFTDLRYDDRQRINDLPRGLVASVSFHGSQHEGRVSASDLALLVRRPMISRTQWPSDGVRIERGDPRALLGQAKLGRGSKRRTNLKWGKLTKPQRRVVPDVLSYYSILLYRLLDPDGTVLSPFGWQLCSGHEVKDIEGWLLEGVFPSETSSAQLIQELNLGRIGTSDPAVIERVTSPEKISCPTIEIRIDWPDRDAPPPALTLARHVSQQAVVKLRG